MSNPNPRVDRYLTDEAFDNIDHALGRHFDPTSETFRNHFATEADGPLARQFDASPHWVRTGAIGAMAYYQVTEAGKQALLQHLRTHAPIKLWAICWQGHTTHVPAISAGKAKYKHFLSVSDTAADLTFAAFTRAAHVWRAA